MSDEDSLVEHPGDDLPAGIAALLARPDIWDAAPPEIEAAVVAAIAAVAAPAQPATVSDLDARREQAARRRSTIGWWAAAAAASVAVVAGAVTLVRDEADGDGVVVALAATDLAPGASGTATFEATPAGLKIVIDTDDLPSAQPGEMYEAWISNGTIRICAGSFHLRGGEGPIELWAGTADPDFHTVTVTREPIDGDTDTSGMVVLRGEFELPSD